MKMKSMSSKANLFTGVFLNFNSSIVHGKLTEGRWWKIFQLRNRCSWSAQKLRRICIHCSTFGNNWIRYNGNAHMRHTHLLICVWPALGHILTVRYWRNSSKQTTRLVWFCLSQSSNWPVQFGSLKDRNRPNGYMERQFHYHDDTTQSSRSHFCHR